MPLGWASISPSCSWASRASSTILNRPGRPRDQIGSDVASGLADLEAYGQMVLANPDFVARLKANAPMNDADRNSFFGGAAQGYIDYPALTFPPHPHAGFSAVSA